MRILKGTLICRSPDCRKEVPATLMENAEGVIQVHEHMCGDCLGIMIFEIPQEVADAYKKKTDEHEECNGNR